MQEPWRGDAYWLVPHGSLSLLSSITRNHLSSGDSTHSERGLPTSTYDQENVPQVCPQAGPTGGFSEVPSSQICQVGIELATK